MQALRHSDIPHGARSVAEDFPLPPGDAGGLFTLSLSELATVEDITGHIGNHPRLAARFVRLGNCSMWGPNEAPNLNRAVQIVGARVVIGGVTPELR